MSNNLPSWGKDLDRDDAENEGLDAQEGLVTHQHSSSEPVAWPSKPKWSPLPTRISRADEAIRDAQTTLGALLNPRSESAGGSVELPNVISSTGASRNQMRGRVAGPSAGAPADDAKREAITGYLASPSEEIGSSTALAVMDGDGVALPAITNKARETGPHAIIKEGLGRATGQYRAIRERAEILIGAGSTSEGDEPTVQYARRSAARWATRYSMHVVILLVVGALVALGGLRTLTARSAFDGTMRAVSAEFEGATSDAADFNSPEFEITLPRTELNSADLAASEDGPQKGNAPLIAQHVVAEGDTIESIAAAYKVLPETIMGSNKLYDPDEALTAGYTLAIPPVDGMYYVVAEGDTLESVAKRFSVEASAITEYGPNNLASGEIAAGQALVVPGGMMPQRYEVLLYTVAKGDSLRDIAARYGVDVPTMIVSNDIADPDNLQIGSELRILPVVGAEHKVKEGDTLQAIAQRMGVSTEAITSYAGNRLEAGGTLEVGQTLMVPGAKVDWESRIPAAARPEPSENQKAAGGTSSRNVPPAKSRPPAKPVAASGPVTDVRPPVKKTPTPKATPAPKKSVSNTPKSGTGRMVWPVSGRITQYFSGRHNGLDIAVRAGTPIVAADSGKVIWSGWRQDGLGYAVIIDHLNGLTTIYGHMIRQPPVYVGQYVGRGQVIGNIGSTGRSTGPHVHFMVKSGSGRNYRNPLSYLGR